MTQTSVESAPTSMPSSDARSVFSAAPRMPTPALVRRKNAAMRTRMAHRM